MAGIAAAVGGMLGIAVLAGCTVGTSSPTPTPAPTAVATGLWAQKIAQGLADPNISDFQRQVLSDYVITDAEYQEAQDRYVQCMAGLGWTVVPQGSIYEIDPAAGNPSQAGSAQQLSDNSTCTSTTIAYIEPIYLGMQSESDGSNQSMAFDLLIRACYVKYGITDGAGLSDDSFSALMHDPDYMPSTPQADLCWLDPREDSGLTPEEAAEAIQSGNAGTLTMTIPDDPSESPSLASSPK